jgi:hypothetical protein
MAWITKKPNGKYLVRWRDRDGRTHSELCSTLEIAEDVKDNRTTQERLANPSREKSDRRLAALLPYKLVSSETSAPQYTFENYLRGLIDADKTLRQTSRETYLHSLKNHIAGTELGDTDIRDVSAETVKAFWAQLHVGIGALRNVYQLLAKAFNHALNVEGIIRSRRSSVLASSAQRGVGVRRSFR